MTEKREPRDWPLTIAVTFLIFSGLLVAAVVIPLLPDWAPGTVFFVVLALMIRHRLL